MASLKKFRRVYFTFVLIYLFNIGITNSSKLDHISGHSQGRNLCNSVKSDFSSLKLETNHDIYIQGKICGGQCCSNNTEFDLKNNAVQKFSAHIKHHTKSLQDVLEKTVYIFQRHILESINQSKNKSLNVFSMVYPAKKSEILLNKLYSVIIEDIQPTNFVNWLRKKQADNSNIENTLNNFFTDLFPLGYHKAINLNYETDGDFHNDYISCLKHAYLDLEPFGSVTNELKLNLESNLLTINDFSNGLLESAKVLSSINKIDLSYLSTTCENQLLKMTYCPICKDISLSNAKICHSYCLNVMRGCLAQLGFSEIDQSWSKVAIEIESLVTNNIQSTNGVLKSIKTIDNLLSTAIMNIMKNGPYLKEKVNINCGSPSFVKAAVKSTHPLQFKINSTSTPTDFLPELLSFLTTISNSKHIYTNIVNSLCSDSNVKNTDIHCWTGDHIDDYSYPLLMPGGAQKYNPEVPLSKDHSPDSPILRELVDKLYKISSSLGNNNPTTRYSDIQGDMADNDEESSGQYDHVNMDDDDDASGSGENPLDAVSSVPPLDASEDKNSTSSIFRSFHSRLVLLFICYFLLAIKS